MQTTLRQLFVPQSPYIHMLLAEPGHENWIPARFYQSGDARTCVTHLRGRKMKSLAGLMNEISAAMQFPHIFGENWPALEECLCYLDEWLPADGYILVISDPHDLLIDDAVDDLATLLKVLHAVGTWWANPITDNDGYNRPARPFHVLLTLTAKSATVVARYNKAALKNNIPIEM